MLFLFFAIVWALLPFAIVVLVGGAVIVAMTHAGAHRVRPRTPRSSRKRP